MEEERKVITNDDIVFEEEGVTFPKGMIFIIEEVTDQGIIMHTEIGERYMIDYGTFEAGFEIYIG